MLSAQQSDNRIKDLKVPPHSIEAEQSVLGGVMIDNDQWEKVEEILLSTDFYVKNHREIFKAMAELANMAKPMDVITLSEHLEQLGEADIGLAYLGELAQNTPTVANIRAYAEIVREKAIMRQLISASNEIADASFNPQGRGLAELLDLAERKVFAIAESRETSGEGPSKVEDILKSTIERIEQIQKTKGGVTGLSTGFTDLDNMTSGLQKADLVIIAARPSMGKTTFAMNIVENAALASDLPVLVFSLEMPSESIIMRSISSLGRLEQNKIRGGQIQSKEDWDKFNSGVLQLKNHTKLLIDDTAGLSPAEMRSRARRVAREHGGIALIMVDYLQLMQVPGMSDNRTLEVSEISRSLKALAKELEVPVIALSQLNRSLEQRSDRRPVMSDLRESGAIEQDADLILFIYRDEVYHPETERKGIAEIKIGKQRNGPIGSVELSFQGKYSRFDNLAHNDYEAMGEGY
ncbi:replicative DNA helicase [Kangiella geojedonensis]|uniref:Replicative DNA helicase n=1 Tax=Kangiella geojedonensis TaxID=914150 RepID=A0A0F6TRY6_9GAMM|nr:replicative DNA helicase [Kangiella geojedonensis]AKE52752.1 DNA helicase [Kangiella geojedonensis]